MQELSKTALLIINPVSGKKQVLKHIPGIIRSFMEGGYAVTVMVTGSRGEATEFARDYGAKYDLVCCTGGDGTLNETLSGLAMADIHVPLGYIPCGSTNDFAMSHNLALDIPTAAENIASGRRTVYDIGKFGDEYFSYVAAFGAFSWLSYTTDQKVKNVLGHTAYILDGIKDLSKIKPIHMRFTANGVVHEDDYLFGAVCNSLSIAGTIEMPKSLVDTSDGIFELLLVKTPKTISELNGAINALLTQGFQHPCVELFQARDIIAESSEPIEWALDGERSTAYQNVEIRPIDKFLELQG